MLVLGRRVVLMATAVLLAGCGGSGPTSGPTSSSPGPSAGDVATPGYATTDATSQPEGSIKVIMVDIKYVPDKLNARVGKVAFYFVNQEPEVCPVARCHHDMVVLDASGQRIAASGCVYTGQSKVFTINSLPAGSYSFYCSIGVHKDFNNMKGTLTVS